MHPWLALFLAVTIPGLPELQHMMARYAPVEIRTDISGLSQGDRQALAKLIEAARLVDDIFLTQLWSGNQALYASLKKDATPLGKARLDYFWLNKGPWSDLDDYAAFVPGAPPRKLPGADFYPEDMRREEFEAWVKTLPEGVQRQAEGFFTVIGRNGARQLTITPYSEAYRVDLARAAKLLHQAAALTDNESLRRFLNLRAEAFLSNDYYASDVAWMDLDAPLDITIGPYETYNDEIFGYKAAYEAYVNLRDDRETDRLKSFASHLQEIEDHLPIEPRYRNPKLGASAPIRVVNEILAAGDGAHGVRTAAYNLPNDERVVHEKGSKRVMLKNIQEAKFHTILEPIAAACSARRGTGRFELRFVFHSHSGARIESRHRTAADSGAGPPHHRAAGIEGSLQRHRRGQGGYHRPVHAAISVRPRHGRRRRGRTPSVHHVSGVHISHPALRTDGCARQRYGDAVQLPLRQRRVRGRAGWRLSR